MSEETAEYQTNKSEIEKLMAEVEEAQKVRTRAFDAYMEKAEELANALSQRSDNTTTVHQQVP